MKRLENDYQLANKTERLSAEDIRRALTDFEFFMGNYQQIVNKERKMVPFKLNAFQRKLFETLLPMVHPSTRLDRRTTVVIIKGRQVGASVGVSAFINYLCAFVEGMENLSIAHTFPATDTVSKFYLMKVKPIITGVHPDLFPTVERENLSSSIVTHYKDIKGIRRNNHYELVSANASSIRSSTINIVLEDECLGGDTEILTSTGYKKIKDVTEADLVAQFSAETELITFTHPMRTIKKKPTRQVYELRWGKNDRTIMTGGHELLLKSKNTNRYKKVELEQVHFNDNHKVPVASVREHRVAELTSRERLLIALQADAHLIEGASYTRARIGLKKERKKARFSTLLERANRDGVVAWNNKTEKATKEGYKVWNFSLKEQVDFKDLTNVFSFNETPERAEAIIQEMLLWDGYLGSSSHPVKHYSTTNKNNADLFMALGSIAGYNASQYVQKDSRSNSHNDVYRCVLSDKALRSLEGKEKTPIVWNDYVYCVTVPDGNIVIRAGQHNYVVGNCAYYTHPEDLDNAIMPALPDYGFSLVVYLSTFEDKKSDFFRNKLKIALDNPEDHVVIFAPWFLSYPEKPQGIDYNELDLTDYDRNVIIPAMVKENVPKERWGDCIEWYHSRARVTPSMKKEYPTTIEEVMEMGQNKCFFEDEAIAWQEDHIEEGTPMELLTDNITKKVKAQKTDVSPFKMYRPPEYGHKYKLIVDPITSMSAESDLFAMSVFDDTNLEQVATFFGREMPVEDYADYAVSIAKLYNNALICPESNVAEGFVVAVRALGYYYFYYDSPTNRAKKIPGIRTTVSTKEALLDKLSLLLNGKKLILHDRETVQEMKTFEKKVKMHADGSVTVKACARKGKRDDAIACLWIYVGTLDQRQLSGSLKVRYSFL